MRLMNFSRLGFEQTVAGAAWVDKDLYLHCGKQASSASHAEDRTSCLQCLHEAVASAHFMRLSLRMRE